MTLPFSVRGHGRRHGEDGDHRTEGPPVLRGRPVSSGIPVEANEAFAALPRPCPCGHGQATTIPIQGKDVPH